MTLLIGDVAEGREAWQRHQHGRRALELFVPRAPRITWLGSALALVHECAPRIHAAGAAVTEGAARSRASSTADLATLMSARLGCTRASAAQLAVALEEQCVPQWLSASPPDQLSELTMLVVRSQLIVLPALSIVPAADDVASVVAESVALACDAPAIEVAVHLTHDSYVHLSRTASTRGMALALEGSIHVEPQAFQATSAPSGAAHPSSLNQTDDPDLPGDARSAAEAFLFQMLESRSSTAGRFVLNERVGVLGVIPSYEVDLCDCVARIAIEIDGYHHFTDHEAYRRDRRKDLALQRSGYIILRFHAEDVVERLESILATIEQVLSERKPSK